MSKNNLQRDLAKVLAFAVWVIYQVLRLSLGLAVHPYRSMREIMRGFWFIPLAFLPSAVLVWIFITGRIAAWVVDLPASYRSGVGIFYSTFVISLVLWQILLFYLAFRFWMGLRRQLFRKAAAETANDF